MIESFDLLILDFVVVLCAAFLATFACQKLKLPPVIGLILAGLAMGPSALGLVGQSELINIIAEIGAILLLFYIGIEFDFSKLIKVAVKAVFFTFIKLFLVFVFLYEVLLLLNLDTVTALLVSFMLSITSTAIMIRILEQKGLSKRGEIPLLVAALIIEDLIAIVGITLVSSLGSTTASLREGILAVSLSLFLLGIAYFGFSRVLKKLHRFLDFERNEDLLLFFSLTLCLALSMIAFQLGLSPAIGAFLAGSLIARLNVGHLAGKVTAPLGLAFSAFFFISIGLLVDIPGIVANLGIALLVIAVQVIALMVFSFVAARAIGFNSRQASFAGVALAVSGEFTLLFAREAAPLSSLNLVGIASLSVVLTAVFSTLFVTKNEKLLVLLRKVPRGIAEPLVAFFRFTSRMASSLEYAGRLHKVLIREQVEIQNDVWKILGAVALLIIVNSAFPAQFVSMGDQKISFFLITAAIVGIVALYSILKILGAAFHVLNAVEETLVEKENRSYHKSGKNLLLAIVLLAVFLVFPAFTDFLKLPGTFRLLRWLPLVLCLLFAWSAVKNQYANWKQHVKN